MGSIGKPLVWLLMVAPGDKYSPKGIRAGRPAAGGALASVREHGAQLGVVPGAVAAVPRSPRRPAVDRWPKRASGVTTDLTENVVRETALDAGLVDNKVAEFDEVWSGLRLVRRLADRG
jgi:hypothetical protein